MTAEEAAGSGIFAYFEKPMQPKAFVDAVFSALDGETRYHRETPVTSSRKIPQNKPLALRFIIESLRADIGSSEVLLGTLDGQVLYHTGGQDSALIVLVENFSEAVMGLHRLANRMGCKSPLTFQSVGDEQIELYLASGNLKHFIALLFHAESRISEIEAISTSIKESLASIEQILHDESRDPTTQAPQLVEIPIDEEISDAELVLPPIVDEEESILEALKEAKEHPDRDSIAPPNVDEQVDLDAFWDDALAAELGEEGSGLGVSYDAAKKLGFLPPEFEPEDDLSE